MQIVSFLVIFFLVMIAVTLIGVCFTIIKQLYLGGGKKMSFGTLRVCKSSRNSPTMPPTNSRSDTEDVK